MTLKEQLKKLANKGYNVKIGANGGQGFLFADKCTRKTIGTFEEINVKYYKKLCNQIANKRERLNNLDRLYKQKEESHRKKYHKNPKKLKDVLTKLAAKKEHEKVVIPRQIEKIKEQREYLVANPLLDRQVVEVLSGCSPDEKPCKIIYFAGIEKGLFATVKEYQRSLLPKEKQKGFNVRLS